jgi:hypothetical protein
VGKSGPGNCWSGSLNLQRRVPRGRAGSYLPTLPSRVPSSLLSFFPIPHGLWKPTLTNTASASFPPLAHGSGPGGSNSLMACQPLETPTASLLALMMSTPGLQTPGQGCPGEIDIHLVLLCLSDLTADFFPPIPYYSST